MEALLADPPEAIRRFSDLVRTWNAKLNLTGARDGERLLEVLLADAAVLADEALVPRGARLVDVGAGAGAPTVPLLLLRPDLRATLVEPIRKRVAFLRTVLGTLDLAGRCSVLERRLEGPPIEGVPYDRALSRATFPPHEWLAKGTPLARGVLVLVARDPLPPGAKVERRYILPSSGAPRGVGLYER